MIKNFFNLALSLLVCIFFFGMPANAQTEYTVQTVCAKYIGTGKSYKVEAQIMKGSELNRRVGGYNFTSYNKYVIIFWGEENASIIELDYSYGPSAMGTEGKDQNGYRWEISTSTSFCY